MLRKLKWSSVVLAAACLICGLVLMLSPGATTRAVVRVFGWIALASGVIHIVDYFAHPDRPVLKRQELTKGLVNLVAALLLLGLTNVVLGFVSVVIGLLALIASVFAVQAALDSRALGHPFWWVSLAASLLGAIFGLVMVFGSISAVNVIATLAGLALFAYGAVQLWTIFFVFDAKS